MPTSSSGATIDKKKCMRVQTNVKLAEANEEKNLLKIESALPKKKRPFVRSHSTLNASSVSKTNESFLQCDPVTLQTDENGIIHVTRTPSEKEKHNDRISLDRRGLTGFPIVNGENKLRLLSLQHNLVNNLSGLQEQKFPCLVFLDIYDNQLGEINFLQNLENLRVLLMGKNRIKRIEGLENLLKLEVLDLHGNQIINVSGLNMLSELKVLNLAGNQIKAISPGDLLGLSSLQELNLRRNKCKKLMGFNSVNCLTKLFVSNNDLQCVEDMSSIAKSPNIKEISIDNNPVNLHGECISFLVSYLPLLAKINNMQVTEQVRKAAMAWRRNKELTNTAFKNLTNDVCLNVRREEVISNARTNWELLRTQTKCLTNNNNAIEKSLINLKPDSDFILTSLQKPNIASTSSIKTNLVKKPSPSKSIRKVPVLPDKKLNLIRTSSQDTENSVNTSSTSNSGNDFFKLPPILVPIINKLEQKQTCQHGMRRSLSLTSIGPNIDSSASSLVSESDDEVCDSSSDESSSKESEAEIEDVPVIENFEEEVVKTIEEVIEIPQKETKISTETSSTLSSGTQNSNLSTKSSSSSENSSKLRNRNVKSAVQARSIGLKHNTRCSTAKVIKKQSPQIPKDREQGGDYLIEICGRNLNIYGQGALRFIDKPWSPSKANDVNTVRFNYVNFIGIAGILYKIKQRFPNVDNFYFKETNINCLGQLNALAELQGILSINIDPEGNPLCEKEWRNYAIYRLSHWGLKFINGEEISDEEITTANEEYQSLSDLVLWSLPDDLLQPLLERLRIDVNNGFTDNNPKKWLLKADPALKSVVSKEALQWKRGNITQDDQNLRQKAKQHISALFDEMNNAAAKLKMLDPEWPDILQEFVRNTLVDYSQLDMYMKRKMQEIYK